MLDLFISLEGSERVIFDRQKNYWKGKESVGHRFIILKHKYGCYDAMCIRSIQLVRKIAFWVLEQAEMLMYLKISSYAKVHTLNTIHRKKKDGGCTFYQNTLADQLAVNKAWRSWKLGSPNTNRSSGREEDLNLGPPDYKSSAQPLGHAASTDSSNLNIGNHDGDDVWTSDLN